MGINILQEVFEEVTVELADVINILGMTVSTDHVNKAVMMKKNFSWTRLLQPSIHQKPKEGSYPRVWRRTVLREGESGKNTEGSETVQVS